MNLIKNLQQNTYFSVKCSTFETRFKNLLCFNVTEIKFRQCFRTKCPNIAHFELKTYKPPLHCISLNNLHVEHVMNFLLANIYNAFHWYLAKEPISLNFMSWSQIINVIMINMTVIMVINESVTDFRYPVKQERTDCQYSYSSSYSDGTPECSTPDSLDMDLSGPGKLIYVIYIYYY